MNTTLLPPANVRLAGVRDSLAELHRALLEAERRDIERETGRLSPGVVLAHAALAQSLRDKETSSNN